MRSTKSKVILAGIIGGIVLVIGVTAALLLSGDHSEISLVKDTIQNVAPSATDAAQKEDAQPDENAVEPVEDVTEPEQPGNESAEPGHAQTNDAEDEPDQSQSSGAKEPAQTDAVIYAESVTVDKSAGTATVNIRVRNNPGIMGAVLKVAVDNKAFEFDGAQKTQFPSLTLTAPGNGATYSPYTFLLDAVELSDEDKKDGTLFSIAFKIKEGAEAGEYIVDLYCDKGAVVDEELEALTVALKDGAITIQ